MPAIEVNFNETENYQPPVFENALAITKMHDGPRLGFTNDITVLLDGTDEEKQEYITGLLVVSILILAIFAIWTLVLLILKCLGRRVGCASGKSPQRRKTILWTRIFFLLSGLGVIYGTIIFVYFGISSMSGVVNNVQQSIDGVDQILVQAVNLTDLFLGAQNDTTKEKDQFIQNEYSWCPNMLNDTRLESLKQEVDKATVALGDLTSGFVQEMEDVRNDLIDDRATIDQMQSNMNNISMVHKLAIVCAFFQLAIALVLVGGVILAWMQCNPRPFRCMQTYFILPIFILMCFLSTLFSCIFIIGSTTGSDFCYGSPDSIVLSILNENKNQLGPLVYNLMVYYIKGCPGDIPLEFSEYTGIVVNSITTIHEFLDSVKNTNTTALNDLCGSDTSGFIKLASLLDFRLHVTLKALVGTRRIFSCSNFNEIYTILTYDAICYNGVSGLAEIYWSQLIIVICSMTMITLRVSWQQAEEEYIEYQDIDEHPNVVVRKENATAQDSRQEQTQEEATLY